MSEHQERITALLREDDGPQLARKESDRVPKPSGFHLVPRRALTALADHYAKGAAKYEPNEWRKGRMYSDYYDALQRHILAWFFRREERDGDGHLHLMAVAWIAFALYTFRRDERDDLDDRPGKPEDPRLRGIRETIDELRLERNP